LGEQIFFGIEAVGGEDDIVEGGMGVLEGVLPGSSSVRQSARRPPSICCNAAARTFRTATATASICFFVRDCGNEKDPIFSVVK
jgi:hypothetical protein